MNKLMDDESLLQEMGETQRGLTISGELDSKGELWREFLAATSSSRGENGDFLRADLIEEKGKKGIFEKSSTLGHESPVIENGPFIDNHERDNLSFEELEEDFERALVEKALSRVKETSIEGPVDDAEEVVSTVAGAHEEKVVTLKQDRPKGNRKSAWTFGALALAASVLIFWVASDRVNLLATESRRDGHASALQTSYQLEVPEALSLTRSAAEENAEGLNEEVKHPSSESYIRRDAEDIQWLLRPTTDVRPNHLIPIELIVYKRPLGIQGKAEQPWLKLSVSQGEEAQQYRVSQVGSIQVTLDPRTTFDVETDEWELLFVVSETIDFPGKLDSIDELRDVPGAHQVLKTRVHLQGR